MEEKSKLEISELFELWDILHSQIKELCHDQSDNLSYSKLSKLPFKTITIVYSMAWRMNDVEEAVRNLVDKNHIHPAIILIRSAMENTAFLHYLYSEINNNIVDGKLLQSTDDLLMQMLYGNNYKKGEFITEESFESFSQYNAIRTWQLMQAIDLRFPGYYSMYRALCEFVHTNGDGVEGSYMTLDIENDISYFDRKLTEQNSLFNPFLSSLILALSIFVELVDEIQKVFPKFIQICDDNIRDKLNSNS